MEKRGDKIDKVVSVLGEHPEGLSIDEIVKKTGLKKPEVLDRLKKLEEDSKVVDSEDKISSNEVQINKKEVVKKVSTITLVKKSAETNEVDIQDIKERHKQIVEQREPIKKVVKNLKIENLKKVKEYVKTGIEGFDSLFDVGIPKKCSILIAGGAGSGKTIFALQTLVNQASSGKKCFYMSFEENREKLIQHMEDFGWDTKKLIKEGSLVIQRMNPFDISRSVEAMLAKQRGELLIEVDPIILPKGLNPDFIVVDSLTSIASTLTGDEGNYRIYIEQLFRFFEKTGSTNLLITETKQIPEIFSTTGVEEFLADGVVVIYNIKRGNIRERAIEVLKLRGAKHQKKIVAMQITDKGVVIYPDQEVFGSIEG